MCVQRTGETALSVDAEKLESALKIHLYSLPDPAPIIAWLCDQLDEEEPLFPADEILGGGA